VTAPSRSARPDDVGGSHHGSPRFPQRDLRGVGPRSPRAGCTPIDRRRRGRRCALPPLSLYALGSGIGRGSTPMARSESGDQPASSP
jgi:hypothetical protein